MPLYFIDETGTVGCIDDDLSVDYGGPFDVQQFVEEVGDQANTLDEARDDLLAELVGRFPIVDAERID